MHSSFQGETGLLRCDGNVGIPFPMKQGIDPHLELRVNTRLFWSCGMNLGVPLQWGWVSQELAELQKWCQMPPHVQRPSADSS